jgi:YfiH family protein
MLWRNSPVSQNSYFLDALSPNSTVLAGFSRGEKGNFNLALHVNDDPLRVIANRKKLCDQLGIPFEAYTCAEQVHGNCITAVTSSEKGRGRLSQEDTIPHSDSLITNEPGIMLNIFMADCVPIIIYDNNTHSGGVCHAGWRGTSQNIILKTVETMKDLYGTDPAYITALIGPSIGGCCYKVGESVRKTFQEKFIPNHAPFEEREDGLYCDLKLANRYQLLYAGLREKNIHTAPECTFCSGNEFPSYRKSGEQVGRFSAFFYLKQ